uniref:L-serine deaminase n=1 Tax=Macrostomum lignano TaxID=282301 RepID=A0A1I8JP07_9PLAT
MSAGQLRPLLCCRLPSSAPSRPGADARLCYRGTGLTTSSQGVLVETCPSSELQSRVDAKVANEGYQFLHPFDDQPLIAGHASLGLELLEQLPQVDTVLLGCGGGGLSAGVAAALALSSKSRLDEDARSADEEPRSPVVYAVEPETACTMRLSFEQVGEWGGSASLDAAGGAIHSWRPGATLRWRQRAYRHLRHFGARSLLVNDAEIGACQRRLARNLGLIVEPSACAGLAALLFDRLEEPPLQSTLL